MKSCLISFYLFRQSFGAGLIHQRLSVRLSLNTNDIQKICSNMCFMIKTDRVLVIKESAISLSTADNDPGSPPLPQKNINVSFFPRGDFTSKGRRSPSSSVSSSSRTLTTRRTIYPDNKNFLLVYPTEVFHVKKKNGLYVSGCLRNRDTKFVGVCSCVL